MRENRLTDPRLTGRDVGISSPSDWRDRAACRGANPDIFAARSPNHPNPEQSRQVVEAKSYCERCPVIHPCGQFARNQTRGALSGVWGGEYISESLAVIRLHEAQKRAMT